MAIIILMKRATVLVLDGVGVGELPDAAQYHDQGSNTLGNLARECRGLSLPTLGRMGLGNITDIEGVPRTDRPLADYGRMAERSPGKDSTTGHWELMGLVLDRPFPTYPRGFPPGVIADFEKAIGHRVLGNYPTSGTEIIKELGREHIARKRPIVYTSADSVFQIACHIDVFPLAELYRFCEIARKQLQGEHAVARVIARPFAGTAPDFYRTADRRDYSLLPPQPTLLDRFKERNYEVTAIGKIDNLFGNRGYTRTYHSVDNRECLEYVLKSLAESKDGLIFANFIQFDMDWGHRNDVSGFRDGLVDIDAGIARVLERIGPDDCLFITADHGNDPTTPSTDHSREYVPILAYRPGRPGSDLGVRESFADLARTIARLFGIEGVDNGKEFF
jgi:phosphopentomutase